ncbi:hypothetical protein MVEN_01891700 [Mycena venus]|uniref:RlpA-like protein double-psi beta-barrel domain-containing protein n=1 Tax=Mycena venus TaxID=2733690 RepID=A0A8H6XJL8_9AGAR|nr:hypothetical protein MVEN_01891700 [Mycena venus]
MVFSKVFTALFPVVLAAAVNASPVASPEANPSTEIAKRTPGNVYLCPQTGWGGICTTISAANTCNNLPGWQNDVQSVGPDSGATCTAYSLVPIFYRIFVTFLAHIPVTNSQDWCGTGGSQWTFTYPGDSTGGWATANPWGLQIKSIYCNTGSTGGGGGTTLGPFTGLATYYDPNGGTGACPPYPVINNWDMAVAIGSGHWDGGAHCGKTMTVTYGSTTISVIVKDLCPGCQGANGIDLTEGAMAAMDPNYIAHGVDSVQWSI